MMDHHRLVKLARDVSLVRRPEVAAPLAIGFDSRTRGFDPVRIIDKVKQLSARNDLLVSTLFLDCSDQELERRYQDIREES